ncbi:MAG: ABC transporter ATP-binding protein [Chloroflexi bacterium]|nr:ABC transporter ATP-binding protein [Chloroflexota bacterium]
MTAIKAEGLSKVYRIKGRGVVQEPQNRLVQGLARIGLGAPFRHRVREIHALNDVSLEVEPGTILGVIGRNGAGKTTLLKLLARVSLPTAGRAYVRGRTVSLLGLGQGFQSHLSGRENIFMQAAMYGIPRAEILESFDRIVEFAGLARFIDDPVGRYSSGMYLRLAFSIAVNMRPDVILADEVLAVGDIEFQERCLRRVEQAGQEGVTTLFVSHDMEAITRLCDQVVRLDRGRIVDQGEPRSVVARYEEALESGDFLREGTTSQVAELVALRLTSPSGLEIDAPRESDDFLIQTMFRTLAPNLYMRPILKLKSRDVVVFASSPPEPVFVEEPGVQTVSVRIPAHLLAERSYQAKVRLILDDGQTRSALNQDKDLGFRVYGEGERRDASTRIPWRRSTRPGLVAPRLDWSFSAQRASVEA